MEKSNEIAKFILSQRVTRPVVLQPLASSVKIPIRRTRDPYVHIASLVAQRAREKKMQVLCRQHTSACVANLVAIRNEERRDRLSNSYRIQSLLSFPCCARRCIAANFSHDQVQNHLRLWSSLDQKTLQQELRSILTSCTTEQPSNDSFVLQGEHYVVKWNGVPLCRVFEDSQKVLLNGYYNRQQVWKAYVDTTPSDLGIASDSHFYSVWKSRRPEYIVETDSLKCPTCSALDLQIHSKAASLQSIEEAQNEKRFHICQAKAHTSKLTKYLYQSKAGKISLLIGDHMRSKVLPKLHRSNLNLLMSQLLNIHFSGWYNGGTSNSQYYLFTEHWSECGNSIISCLHRMLMELNFPKERKLVLVFDNHSTQHNNAVLAYCDWLVRYAHRFDKIKILFLIAGHTKNAQDQLNSYVAYKFSKGEFFSVQELCMQLADSKRHFSADVGIMDWHQKFERDLNQYGNIFKAHVFEFTAAGMRTKQYADDPKWNEWKHKSPDHYHAMLQQCPSGLLNPMQPYALSETKKKDIRKALDYVPQESRAFLQSMLEDDPPLDLRTYDCLHDFSDQHDTDSSTGANVTTEFRTKKRKLSSPTLPKPKKRALESSIKTTEIRDLLQTQSPAEQMTYNKILEEP